MADIRALVKDLPASSRPLTNSTPMNVAIVNGIGDHVTSFGGTGGTSADFDAAFPLSGTPAGFKDGSGNMKPGLVDGSGYIKVNVAAGGSAGQSPATPTISTVAADGSNHTAFSADANRLSGSLHNRTQVSFLLKAGATAAASSLSWVILPGERLTILALVGANYQGQIDAISDGVDGSTNAALYVTSFAA